MPVKVAPRRADARFRLAGGPRDARRSRTQGAARRGRSCSRARRCRSRRRSRPATRSSARVTPVEQKDTVRLDARRRLSRDARDRRAERHDLGRGRRSDPGGARSSAPASAATRLAHAGREARGWAWPAFVERTHEAYRAYYEFVPKGRFKIEYTVRLNNPAASTCRRRASKRCTRRRCSARCRTRGGRCKP